MRKNDAPSVKCFLAIMFGREETMPETDKTIPRILLTKEPLDRICAIDGFPSGCASVSLEDLDELHVVAYFPDKGLVGKGSFWFQKKGDEPVRLDTVADPVELIDGSPMKKAADHWHLFELRTKVLEAGGIYSLSLNRFPQTWPHEFTVKK